MFFRKKPKQRQISASYTMEDAIETTNKNFRDRKYIATEQELLHLDKLVRALFANYAAAQYISRRLRARMQGK
jgi:hypothetical protein